MLEKRPRARKNLRNFSEKKCQLKWPNNHSLLCPSSKRSKQNCRLRPILVRTSFLRVFFFTKETIFQALNSHDFFTNRIYAKPSFPNFSAKLKAKQAAICTVFWQSALFFEGAEAKDDEERYRWDHEVAWLKTEKAESVSPSPSPRLSVVESPITIIAETTSLDPRASPVMHQHQVTSTIVCM